MCPTRGERGAGSLLAAGVVVIVSAVAGMVLLGGAYLVAVQQTRGIADSAAIAGAAAYRGFADPCAAASETAERNGAALLGCDVDGDSLDFVVSITVGKTVGLPRLGAVDQIKATAFAGHLSG